MGAGKYVVKLYDKRTRETISYLGSYKSKSDALRAAKGNEKAIKAEGKNWGVSIID